MGVILLLHENCISIYYFYLDEYLACFVTAKVHHPLLRCHYPRLGTILEKKKLTTSSCDRENSNYASNQMLASFYNRLGCYNLNRLDASAVGIQVI